MTDNYTDDVLDDDDFEAEDQTPKALRRQANKAKKLEAELTAMRRELAFARAGLPMDDPKMSYFIKGYEGDLESDAIRSAALEAGFLQSATTVQEAPKAPDLSAQTRIMQASAGAAVEDISENAAIARLENFLKRDCDPAVETVVKSVKKDISDGAFSVYTTNTDNLALQTTKVKREQFMKEGFDFKDEFERRFKDKGLNPEGVKVVLNELPRDMIDMLNSTLHDNPGLERKEVLKHEAAQKNKR